MRHEQPRDRSCPSTPGTTFHQIHVGRVSWILVRAGKTIHRARAQEHRWSDTIIQPDRVPSKQGGTHPFIGTRPLISHSSNLLTKDFRNQLPLSICTKQEECPISLGSITWRTSYIRCPMAYHTIPYWSDSFMES